MKRNILKDRMILDSSISSQTGQTPGYKGILYERLDDGYGNPILKKVGENTVVVGGAMKLLSIYAMCKPIGNRRL